MRTRARNRGAYATLRGRGAVVLALLLVAVPVAAGGAAEVRRMAYTLLNEGVTAYKNGDFTTAIEKLRGSAAVALNSFRAHFYLGLALQADRRYAEAIEALEIALDLDPNHLQSLVALGDAQLKIGDVAEANASYFRALKLRPEFPEALDGLGRVLETQNRTDEAIRHFQRAIAANRGFAPAYAHLGDLYLRLGRFEEAVHLLEEAVSVRPDFADGLNRLALAYGKLGLANEAIATIQHARDLEPRNPGHAATLGVLQLGQGALGAAERSFQAALAFDARHPEALAGLAEVARRRGDYAGAVSRLDEALSDPRLDAQRAARLRAYREEVLAEQQETTALEARVAEGAAGRDERLRLAVLRAKRDQWAEAAELLSGLEPGPDRDETLAYALFRASRFREAHELYAALARSSPSATAALNDGVVLAWLGDERGAIAAYERALGLDPSNPSARLYLANAWLRLGERQRAVAEYKSFLDAGASGARAERVRRILAQIAPGALPPAAKPLDLPPEPPPPEPAPTPEPAESGP